MFPWRPHLIQAQPQVEGKTARESFPRRGIASLKIQQIRPLASPSARARPGGAVGEAARAMVGDGGAVSWHGSARAISLLIPLRLRPINPRLPEFLGAFEQPSLAAG